MTQIRRFSAYADRNSAPILGVLEWEFAAATSVLEIGSGTGQHAVCMAENFEHLHWQCSDVASNVPAISAQLATAPRDRLPPPLQLDVQTDQLPEDAYDAVFSANTAHIMSIDSVRKMFELVATTMTAGGTFCLYGPFRKNGNCNSPSNASFHQSLRTQDPLMGIRDIEELDAFGDDLGLSRQRIYAMPANNHIAVWAKKGA